LFGTQGVTILVTLQEQVLYLKSCRTVKN